MTTTTATATATTTTTTITTTTEIDLPHNMEPSNCDNLLDNTWEDEILVDTAKNQWRLGKLISDGEFDEV
jgi:hypothetical protein